MKHLEGWELVELTDTKIVQRKMIGNNMITISGNPNPDPEEHKRKAQELVQYIYDCVEKRKAREELERERNNEIYITDRERVLQNV